MFVEVHDGKVPYAHVKEFDGAIAACDYELVLVDLGPGKVVLRIVGVEAATGERERERLGDMFFFLLPQCRVSSTGYLRLLDLDPPSCETQGEDTAIADNAKVGGRGDSDARIVVGGVFDGVRVVALRAKL